MIKNIFLALLFTGLMQASYGQEYKGSVSKASGYLANGDLVKAKGEIDKAITIEKLAGKGRTWSVRGMIYKAIAESQEAPGELETVDKAGEAFSKALALEKQGSYFYNEVSDTLGNYYARLVNTGINDFYNENDYKTAVKYFDNANAIKQGDSLALYLVSSTALQVEEYDLAIERFNEMIERKYDDKTTFQNLIYIYRVKKDDNEAAMRVVTAAKERYPEEPIFVREEISILVAEDKLDEARIGMEKQLESDPSNIQYTVNLGIIYDNLATNAAKDGDDEEAAKLSKMAVDKYEKAVALDPENYAANKNLASFYVNKANDTYKAATDDMDYKTYLKQGEKHEKVKIDTYLKGLPYLEKAAQIKSKDIQVLEELKQMYVTLKMTDKASTVQDKIDAIN